jgi:hypothetical protein
LLKSPGVEATAAACSMFRLSTHTARNLRAIWTKFDHERWFKFEVSVADDVTMMNTATDIATALDLNSSQEALEAMFAGQGRGTTFEACRELMREQRQEFLDALVEVVDDDDVAMLLATRYIEQKSRWLQWNLVLNYRTMTTGRFDADLAFRASALSYLLGKIEPFIDETSLIRINELLNEPILQSS